MSRRALGSAFCFLCLMGAARSVSSQQSEGPRWRMAGAWVALGPNAPFETRLGTKRHNVYVLGLRAERALLQRGAMEVYHTVDLLPLVASTVTPIRYDEGSCGGGGITPNDRAQTDCSQWIPQWGTIYGFGFAPAGLEVRHTARSGLQIVAGPTLGVLYFTQPMPDPTAARLNFSVAAYLGVRIGAW